MVAPRARGLRLRARRPDAGPSDVQRDQRTAQSADRRRARRRLAPAVRRPDPHGMARPGLRHRAHGSLEDRGWHDQEDRERQGAPRAGRAAPERRRPDDRGDVRGFRAELGMEGHTGREQRRQVQRLRGAVCGPGRRDDARGGRAGQHRAESFRAGVRVPDAGRRSPPRRPDADPPRRCTVRSRGAERREAPPPRGRVEPVAGDFPRQPRRALAQRRKDRGVRARHGTHGLGARREQVPLHPGVRGAAQGAHRLAGSRGRGLFPQHQGEGAMKRRKFLKTASAAGLGLVAPRGLSSLVSRPSEQVVVAVMGLNGRGAVLGRTFARTPNALVAYVCDVAAQVLAKGVTQVGEAQSRPPKGLGDFRRALEAKSVDALVIAAPDHWHTPAALLAMQAGKHVYVEKPCVHNAREAELLVEAQRKHERAVQMGTQRRSAPRPMPAGQALNAGAIGQPYLARAWYANTRATIGRGKAASVPANLDYELWQGPAPHTPYRDNVVHYNWHWFRRWGTGEICNNGTHEIDVARCALCVDYPVRLTSMGGRHHFDDDWEFPDTQEACFEFAGGKTIIWQGQSCNGLTTYGRGRGTAILGTMGSVVMDRDGYTMYDLKEKVVKSSLAAQQGDGHNTHADDDMTAQHIANFVDAIRTGAALHQPIEEGAKSVLLGHLGNIAQSTGRALRTDPVSGRITGDDEAMKLWQREYAPGWAPVV